MTPYWVMLGHLKLAEAGIFTPQQLAKATKEGLVCCFVDLRTY